jgi:hypothetical protein
MSKRSKALRRLAEQFSNHPYWHAELSAAAARAESLERQVRVAREWFRDGLQFGLGPDQCARALEDCGGKIARKGLRNDRPD